MKDYKQTFLNTFSSKKTQISYLQGINNMEEYVQKDIHDIKRIDLVEWKNTLKRYSTATQALYIKAVKSYFKFLEEVEILPNNPASKLSAPRVINKPKDALDREVALKMLNAAKNPRDKAIIALYLSTGIRVQELIDIQYQEYVSDPQHLTLKVKGGKYRKISLNQQCQNYINNYLKVRKTGVENLFVGNKGNKMRADCISSMLKRMAHKVGYEGEVSNHTLRSTFITDVAMNHGVVMAQIMVNHSNINTTRKYIRGVEDQAQEIMSEMTL